MNLRNFGDKCSASLLTLCAVATLLSLSSGYAMAQGIGISGGGTPSYDFPIGVPPGISGMTPKLALHYSSGGVNGPVGLGWNVQGISLITRCQGNKRADGKALAVTYTGNDKLCLDGQRLIQTDTAGNPVASQQGDSLGGAGMVREYRTEKDIYSRIRAYGSNGDTANGPAYFRIWTKGGQIYEYGNAAAGASITVTGKSVVSAWAVNRISDTVGNYIDFRYTQRDVAWGSGTTAGTPTPGREWKLNEVLYTGTANQQAVNRVVFDYAERPSQAVGSLQDRSEAYHQGGKNVSIWLLDKVSTYINWPASQADRPATAVHVKTIKLGYDNGPTTGRSRLSSVRECVDTGLTKCLPPTTFSYSPGGGLNYSSNLTFRNSELSTTVLHSADGKYGVLTGDFFGNGRSSILRWSSNPAENRMFRSDGDGAFTAIPVGNGTGQFNLTNKQLYGPDYTSCFTSTALDFNGDGLTDILTSSSCSYFESAIYLSKGDGSFQAVNIGNISLMRFNPSEEAQYDCAVRLDEQDLCPAGNQRYLGVSRGDGQDYYFLDVNNDGLLDIVTLYRPGYGLVYSSPPSADSQCATMVCTRVFLGQANSQFVELPGVNVAHKALLQDGLSVAGRSYVTDVNGDGLHDLVLDTGTYLSRGDGNFDIDTTNGTRLNCVYGFDFNGDERTDCVMPDKDAAKQKLLVSNGITQTLAANFNLTPAGTPLFNATGGYATIQTADFDGDGRDDILSWNDDPGQNRIYLSNGDGTFRNGGVNLTSASDLLQKSDGSARFILGDFSGKGAVEVLRLKASPSSASDATRNQLYVKGDPMPPDQLISVRTGNGITTNLTWVPLTNSASGNLGTRYVSDRGTPNAAVYPMADVLPSSYVVATVTSNAGFGGAQQVTEYAYSGMKIAHDGRGWLGFRNNRTQSMAPNGDLLTVTTYNTQNGTNPGPASVTETRLGGLTQLGAPLLSRSTFVYCDKTAAAGAQAAATSSTPCPTSAKVQRPYLYQSIEEGWDLQGIGLPKVTTTNVFNNDGDTTDILMVTASTTGQARSSSMRTTNEYHTAATDGDSWVLGRLKKSTVFNDVTNSSTLSPTSAGSAPLATANVGTGAEPSVTPLVPSVNPAVLNQIIMLLLGDD